MVLNDEKTLSVFFSTNRSTVTMEDLDQGSWRVTSEVKMLGIHLDRFLQWSCHIEHLCQKLRGCCFALRSLSGICSREVMLVMYHACFHSLLRYGVIFWGTASDANRVFIIQKYAIRVINGLSCRESCRAAFKELNILTFYATYIYEVCCFVYKHYNKFTRNQVGHNYPTRSGSLLLPDAHRTTFYQKGIFYNGCKFFNALPDELKIASNFDSFKRGLRILLSERICYTLEEFFL